MPGTLAVTAQSPSETRVFVAPRTSLILCRSSSLLTAPSTSVTSTFSGNILGVDQRAVDQVGQRRQVEQALVHIEK